MKMQTLDGKCYARMLRGGAALLSEHIEELNDMNVFPVSDGDTGSNMLKTLEGGLAELGREDLESIGTVSEIFARGVFIAARGNSGIILSQIFAGIYEDLKKFEKVTALELAKAYRNGIKKAYEAVKNPVEGTILTVFRESTEYAVMNITEKSTVDDFFRLHNEEARRCVASTKKLLPVLSEADVVDSGAAGYLYIAEGMYNALTNAPIPYEYIWHNENKSVNIDLFPRDSVLEYGYCTEFLLRLTTSKVEPDKFEVDTILLELERLDCESIVAYKQNDVVRVHVHTFSPGDVLARMQRFGEFLTVKIENMSLGYSERKNLKHKNNKKFSVVAVAFDDGISTVFKQMGAEHIVLCKQGENLAVDNFLSVFEECKAENIIVFPNDENILISAERAAEIYKDAKIYIVESKNMIQGYSALSVITPGITDVQALVESAERAADSVIDAKITKAESDVNVEGVSVKCGDYVAICQGRILVKADTAEAAALKLLEAVDMELCEIITLFAGNGILEDQRDELVRQIKQKFGEYEIVVYEGGQDKYGYCIAIE